MWFFLVALALTVVIHFYLYWRLVRDTTQPGRWRRIGKITIIALAVVLTLAFLSRYVLPGAADRVVAWVGYLWLAVMLYLTLALLVAEVPALVWRLARQPNAQRRRFLARVFAGAAGLIAVSAVGYGVTQARPPRLERREVLLDRLDPRLDGFTIAVLADIHLGPLVDDGDLTGIVRQVNDARPDLVAIVGDLVDGTVEDIGDSALPLRELRSPAGTFFVTGNHEYFSGAQGWCDFLPTLGVRVLRNEREEITSNGASFDLAGIDDRTAARSGVSGHGADLDAAMSGRDPERAVVLLAHQPVMVELAERRSVDLQISGHTHGGQLWPFGVIVLLDQPVIAGLVRVGGTWLYVTRGTGFWGPPVRVGAPPEITLLTLRSRR